MAEITIIYFSGTGNTWWAAKQIGNMQRKPFRKMSEGLRDDLSIDIGSCRKCGKCVRLCPADNISIDGHNKLREFSGRCILCLRCYNFCPDHAIMYRGQVFAPGKTGKEHPYRGPLDSLKPGELKI